MNKGIWVIVSGVIIAVLAAMIIGEGRFAPSSSEPDYYSDSELNSNVDNSTRQENLQEQEYKEPTISPVPTPVGIRNPSGPVKAGEQVLAGDFGLFVKREFSIHYKGLIQVYPVLTNVSSKAKLFSFTESSISLHDNLGNEYLPGCEEDLYVVKQKLFEPGYVEELVPDSYHCFDSNADDSHRIQHFIAPIDPSASQLILKFNDFGPFNNVEFLIDL